MTKQFRDFLKSNALYDNYIRNNNGESENPYTYFDNFHWESSEEGYEYWASWDDVWLEKITNE